MLSRILLLTTLMGLTSLLYGQNVEELYAKSYQLEKQNRFNEAYALSLQIIRLEDTYDSWLLCGWLAWKAGRTDDAAKAYEGALLHVPNSLDAQLGLLATFDKRGIWIQAEVLARQILSSTPGNIAARRYYAHALYRQKKYREASDQYGKILHHSPNDKDMALGFGLSLWELGQEKSARYWLKKAGRPVRDKKKNSDTLAKANIYFFNGNYSKHSFYGDFSGQQVVVEGNAGGNFGFTAHYTKLDTPNENQGSLEKSRLGFGVVYNSKDKRYLLQFTSLSANENYLGEGEIISLYAGENDCGLALDCGNFDDFSTMQLTIDFLCVIDDKIKLIISPMIQRRSGTLIDTRRYEKVIESLGFTIKRNDMWFGGYFGNRWFPVSASGQIVWDADEEYQYGLEAGLKLGHGKLQPTLSIRYDKLESQLGIESSASSLTYTAGCTVKF